MAAKRWDLGLTLLLLSTTAQPQNEPRPLYIFVHIPRSGGIVFGSALESLVGKDAVCHMRHLSPNSEPWPTWLGRVTKDPAMQVALNNTLSKCNLLWDHIDYGVPELLRRITNRDTHIITQLRNPVDRFLSSHFKQFQGDGPEIAHSKLLHRIDEMQNGPPLKHMLMGYLGGCAVPVDPATFQKNCGNADDTYAAALQSVGNTSFLGLSSNPAAALRKFYEESNLAASRGPLKEEILAELSNKAEIGTRWYSGLVTEQDRVRLSQIFAQDESLYRAAETRIAGFGHSHSEL